MKKLIWLAVLSVFLLSGCDPFDVPKNAGPGTENPQACKELCESSGLVPQSWSAFEGHRYCSCAREYPWEKEKKE